MYELILPKAAQKELDRIEYKYYSKIEAKIFGMEINPRPVGCIKLSDREEYRLRVGIYRILYEINEKEKKVIIYKIEHRKDAYR